jgi:AbrB family looped-hinge helix DNA binding protein
MPELTKISTKGQIVIPQEVRDALGLTPGDTMQVEQVGNLIVVKKVTLSSLKDELPGGKR